MFCSMNRQAADLYEVLTVMSREQRTLPDGVLPTVDGRSFLTAWLAPLVNRGREISGKL